MTTVTSLSCPTATVTSSTCQSPMHYATLPCDRLVAHQLQRRTKRQLNYRRVKFRQSCAPEPRLKNSPSTTTWIANDEKCMRLRSWQNAIGSHVKPRSSKLQHHVWAIMHMKLSLATSLHYRVRWSSID